ncbi:hypothetical protein [Finegoldia magna]|uniref:hypothetical protein n=1 Tax=Finegoldia magna TaxID=1260 RepID=UPI00290F3342|nr:hypothetical protein [Finegoldia magna]MDU4730880.1 hypothetical protein [Finegoldia magna]
MSSNQEDLDEQIKDFVVNNIDKQYGCIEDVKILDDRFRGGMLICVVIYDPVGRNKKLN